MPRPQNGAVIAGRRLAERRVQLGLSQKQLADQIGVTYQQVHKYERGLNRMSTPILARICPVLNCTADFFVGEGTASAPPPDDRQRLRMEIARNLTRLPPEHLEAVGHLVSALATSPEGNTQ